MDVGLGSQLSCGTSISKFDTVRQRNQVRTNREVVRECGKEWTKPAEHGAQSRARTIPSTQHFFQRNDRPSFTCKVCCLEEPDNGFAVRVELIQRMRPVGERGASSPVTGKWTASSTSAPLCFSAASSSLVSMVVPRTSADQSATAAAISADVTL